MISNVIDPGDSKNIAFVLVVIIFDSSIKFLGSKYETEIPIFVKNLFEIFFVGSYTLSAKIKWSPADKILTSDKSIAVRPELVILQPSAPSIIVRDSSRLSVLGLDLLP